MHQLLWAGPSQSPGLLFSPIFSPPLLIGIPESVEGPTPTSFFPELLEEVFGDSCLDSPPECDSAHRSLVDRPKPGQRPRSGCTGTR